MKANQGKSKEAPSQAPKQMEQQKKETHVAEPSPQSLSQSTYQRRSVRFDVV